MLQNNHELHQINSYTKCPPSSHFCQDKRDNIFSYSPPMCMLEFFLGWKDIDKGIGEMASTWY
jgi:hypothetical protein